jgi:choline dehydrogenase-like flavoprotein
VSYDVVIVGSGSAGCVIARRLVDSGARVLVLEAGGEDTNPEVAAVVGVGMVVLYRSTGAGPVDAKEEVEQDGAGRSEHDVLRQAHPVYG